MSIIINDDKLSQYDMLNYIKSIVNEQGLVNITGYNNLLDKGIPLILSKLFKIERKLMVSNKIDNISHFMFNLEFSNVSVSSPTYVDYMTGASSKLFPNMARKSRLAYTGAINTEAEIKLTAVVRGGKTM